MNTTNKAVILYNRSKNLSNIKIKYCSLRTRKGKEKEASIKDILDKQIKGYEAIFGACRDYAEYDKSFKTEMELKDFIELNQETIINEYCEATNQDKGQLTILTAHGQSKGKFKFSLHIRGSKHFNCGSEVKKQLKQFKFTFRPDWSTYKETGKRQLMRMLGSSKEGENRPLVLIQGSPLNSFISLEPPPRHCCAVRGQPLDRGQGNPEPPLDRGQPPPKTSFDRGQGQGSPEGSIKEAIEIFKKSPDGKNHIFRNSTQKDGNIIITLDRISPSKCEQCNRTHDRDNTAYIVIFKDGGIFKGCNKSDNPLECLKTVKQSPADRIKQSIKKALKTPKEDIGSIKFNQQRVSDYEAIRKDIMNFNGIIGIKAPMGTGKTYSNVRDVKAYLEANPDARVLVISMRVSLANKYKQEYKGFTSYYSNKGAIKANRIICQLDSLSRINWTGQMPDLVIIDEATQAIKHLTSSTFIKQRAIDDNLKTFKCFIKHSKKVVLMDANLDNFTINFIKGLRGNDEARIYENEHKVEQKIIRFLEKKQDLIDQIDRNLRNGERVYIANNYSNEGILTLEKRLKKEHPGKKIIAICRETLNNEEVKGLLADTSIWKNYDCIISSPSIQGGISCDDQGAFDYIYGIFNNGSCGAADGVQMLGRIRKPKHNNIYIHIKHLNNGVMLDNENDYMNYLLGNREHTFESGLLNAIDWDYNEFREVEFKNDWFLKFYCRVKARENRLNNKWMFEFMKLQAQAGHKLEFSEGKLNKEELKQSNEKTTEAKIEVREEKITKLEKARDITDEEYRELQDKKEQTEQEAVEIERRYIREHYKYNGKLDYEFIEKYNDKKIMKIYSNRLLFINENTIEDNLKELKEKEIITDRKLNRAYLEDGQHRIAENNSRAILKSLGFNFKYPKFSLLLNWIKILGFEELDGIKIISREDIKLNLIVIIENMDIEKVRRVLGKRKQRMTTIKNLKHTDKNFIKNGLRFINGVLTVDFGYSIAATDTNRTHYELSDSHPGLFKRQGADGAGYELIADREKYTYKREDKKREITEDEIEKAKKRLGL